MLTLSKELVFGLHGLHYLSLLDRPAGIAEIARASRIPLRALTKIFRLMRRRRLIVAVPGRGYTLGRAPGTISLLDVAESFGPVGAPPKDPCRMNYDVCPVSHCCRLAPACREIFMSAHRVMQDFSLLEMGTEIEGLPSCATDPRRVRAAAGRPRSGRRAAAGSSRAR